MKRSTPNELSKKLGIPKGRALKAAIKGDLIKAILKVLSKQQYTHAEIAHKTGITRPAVTGSLQKVTLDRILKIIDAAGLPAEIKIKKAA
jgi:predicted XRE-type DNA-binding protein